MNFLSLFSERVRFVFVLLFFLSFSGLQGVAQDALTNAADLQVASSLKVRIVFFTPSDLAPPSGVRERLTKIADATEKFFFKGMNHWAYPAAVSNLFQREADGLVKVLNVRGDKPVKSGKYDKPNYAQDVIKSAASQYHLAATGQVWWIFIYLGDRPARFQDFRGSGNSRNGGWAMVNYDSLPGEVRPDLGLAESFNGEIFLKGTIHELGHAFGLPHLGPDVSLGLGNSLMGPATVAYTRRNYPKPGQNYLTEASAAMLWKHPIFSGIAMDHVHPPNAKLIDYKPVFNRTDDTITVFGKLSSDEPAHSVVLIDDQGKAKDEYWVQSHVARIHPDGTFQIKINKPVHVDGHYRILFCFDNGVVSAGQLKRPYNFSNGDFHFTP